MAALARTNFLRGEGGGAGGMTSSGSPSFALYRGSEPKLPPATVVPERGGRAATRVGTALEDASSLCKRVLAS